MSTTGSILSEPVSTLFPVCNPVRVRAIPGVQFFGKARELFNRAYELPTLDSLRVEYQDFTSAYSNGEIRQAWLSGGGRAARSIAFTDLFVGRLIAAQRAGKDYVHAQHNLFYLVAQVDLKERIDEIETWYIDVRSRGNSSEVLAEPGALKAQWAGGGRVFKI